jgi:hypothetical protein
LYDESHDLRRRDDRAPLHAPCILAAVTHDDINDQCARALLDLHASEATMIRVYCDTGGFDKRLLPLVQAGRIKLHTFKYENRNRQINAGAIPSDLRHDDAPTYTHDDLKRDEFLRGLAFDDVRHALATSKLDAIIGVLGKHRRTDAQHLDSACMTGCRAFLTSDKDIAGANRPRLEAITDMRIFRPASDDDWRAFVAFIDGCA